MDIAVTVRGGVTPRCAICHGDALDAPLLCPECHTVVHAECRVGAPCPTLGCAHNRSPERAPAPKGPPPALWRLGRAARRVFPPLVVASVLAGAAFVGVGSYSTPACVSRQVRAESDLRMLTDAARLYRLETGRSLQRLVDLTPRYVHVDADLLVPRDPWGNPYRYDPDTRTLSSDGPDATPGTDDDVTRVQ